MPITDIHCHLQDAAFAEDLQTTIAQSEKLGIHRLVVNGTSPEDWAEVSQLAIQYPQIIPQFGVHPWKVENLSEDWEQQLKDYLLKHPQAGLGEMGLDRQLTTAPIALQVEILHVQLALARSWDRPVTVHLINAWQQWDAMIKELLLPRTLLHSFGGSKQQLKSYVEKGCYFSFGGNLLRPHLSPKLCECIKAVPQDRLLLETDAPFQHPLGKSKRQVPQNVVAIAEVVAELRKIKLGQLLPKLEENAKRYLFTQDCAQP
ncbi:TatD family hydrolase [Kiritimatiellota bacterium B12222]|nr:TatD family hydrolase [Kiritimatiellota bacterium B12222]